jgi:hypothetical protein
MKRCNIYFLGGVGGSMLAFVEVANGRAGFPQKLTISRFAYFSA